MLNIEICDDSKDFADSLKIKLEKIAEKFNIETNIVVFYSLEELEHHLRQDKIDALFLDIMFSDESSIDWCINNLKNINFQTIFMTSFPEQAYNISEFECSYYLIKTRTDEAMLEKAFIRILNTISQRNPNLMIVKIGAQSITIDAQEICYVEGKKNNIILHMKGHESITVYSTLSAFSKTLPPYFKKIHKSFIINMNYVYSTNPHQFVLKDSTAISVNVKNYKKLVAEYQDYIKLK